MRVASVARQARQFEMTIICQFRVRLRMHSRGREHERCTLSTLSKLPVGPVSLARDGLPMQQDDALAAPAASGTGLLGRGVTFNSAQRDFMSRFEASKLSRARAGTGNAAAGASFSQAHLPVAVPQESLTKRKALPFRGEMDK